jgi:pimeloyl-ACP methyl ester carboxylesterase
LQRSAASLVAGTIPTMRERLYALNIPRAHIYGERSLPDPDTEEMKTHGIKVGIVPKSGHDMPFENPDGLAEQIALELRA